MVGLTILARGPLWTTGRVGQSVIRRPARWLPAPLQHAIAAHLIGAAERVGGQLPVAPLRLRRFARAALVVQPYLRGAVPLRRLSQRHLADPVLVASLCRFWDAAERCWEQTGWLPDIGGRVYLPWELYQPLRTDNVLIDVGNAEATCWLVDVAASAPFHCARWPTARLHAALMHRAIRRCRARLLARAGLLA